VWPAAVVLAKGYRRLLRGTTFVGITGSAGKTTAKELAFAVLSTTGRTICSPSSRNRPASLAKTLLKTTPRHRFFVQEFGAGGPETLDGMIAFCRPQIGVVLNVGLDHYSEFRSREAVAEEKSKLVRALPARGTAVLNTDDPYVGAMAEKTQARVVTIGTTADAEIRAKNIRSAWPDRLSFTLCCNGAELYVRTRLCGKLWIPSVLAAFAVGHAVGVPIKDALAAVAEVEPFSGRMSPVVHPDGVTFIRDDSKAPFWSIELFLDYVSDARAKRRIVVVGKLSDIPGKQSSKYRQTVRKALDVAEQVVLIGPTARYAAKLQPNYADRIRLFSDINQAVAYFREELRNGDVVFLKGSHQVDHLEQIVLAREGPMMWFCDDCCELRELQTYPTMSPFLITEAQACAVDG
jgi:UDP-N-acetylmuramyl pentapeptide synthase